MRIIAAVVIVALLASGSLAGQGAMLQLDQVGAGNSLVQRLKELTGKAATELEKILKRAWGLDEFKPPQNPWDKFIQLQRYLNDELKPVPLINGEFQDLLGQKDSLGLHRAMTKAEKATMQIFARSVGRIEARWGASVQAFGTGFVVPGGGLATNCHVVDELEQTLAAQKAQNPKAFVVFGGSGGKDPRKEFALDATVARPAAAGLDVAVMAFASGAAPVPAPLPISSTPVTVGAASTFFVGVLGYPDYSFAVGSYVTLRNKLNALSQPTGLTYLPGSIVEVRQAHSFNSLYHVANTLPKNSGSPVISLDRLEVVGVHACCAAEGPVKLPAYASSCAKFTENLNYKNVAISAEAALGNSVLKPFFTVSPFAHPLENPEARLWGWATSRQMATTKR